MTTKNEFSVSSDYTIRTPKIFKKVTEDLGSTIFKHMEENKNKLAQIDSETGESNTYEELLTRSIRTAIHLLSKNIKRGDIVSLCTHYHLDSIIPFIATQFIGATVAPLDPSLSVSELKDLLQSLQPKILFTNKESLGKLEEIQTQLKLNFKLVVFGSSNSHTEFHEFIQTQEKEEDFRPLGVTSFQEAAVIYCSSGTTASPKAVCLSHYTVVNQIYNILYVKNPDDEVTQDCAEDISSPQTILSFSSLHWISGGLMTLIAIFKGFCSLIASDFNAKKTWNLIRIYKPFILVFAPLQAIEMLEVNTGDVDVTCVKHVSITGSAMPKEYIKQIIKTFNEAAIVCNYGQTETCGATIMFNGTDKVHKSLLKEKPESAGLPLRGFSYKVVDITTNQTLGPYQKGELYIKSKLIMNGYYNHNSLEPFDKNGWFKTGDIVYYDKDFCFYIMGRTKECFKYKGWIITPVVLENELCKHPGVKQAVVIGIPKEDGYHPMGLVVPRDNFKVTEKELEKFVEDRVPERQRLRAGVKLVKSIPISAVGKVKKKELVNMVLDGRL